MSRLLHVTEGLVLAGRPVAEADKFYFIFTKELGLVRAVARGVRLTKSKLRYSLTDFSFGLFTLVRGREIWHLAGAESQSQVSYPTDKSAMSFVKRTGDFLRRFVPPEEADEKIYQDIKSAIVLLPTARKEDFSILETLIFFRVMSRLGYIKISPELTVFMDSEIDLNILKDFVGHKTEAIKLINQAMSGSHL